MAPAKNLGSQPTYQVKKSVVRASPIRHSVRCRQRKFKWSNCKINCRKFCLIYRIRHYYSRKLLLRFHFFSAQSVIVTTIFWARVLCSLAAQDACFRIRITLGVVLIRSLVFHVCVPECSRNGFGMRPYLLVQEKFV